MSVNNEKNVLLVIVDDKQHQLVYKKDKSIQNRLLDKGKLLIESVEEKREETARLSFSFEDLIYHVLIEDKRIFLILCGKEYRMTKAFSILNRLCNEDVENQREIKKITDEMEFDKVDEAKEKLGELQSQTLEVLDEALKRGEKVENLHQAASNLEASGKIYRRSAKTVRNQMILRWVIIILAIIGIVLFCVWMIVWIACGISFERCGNTKKD